MKFYAHKGFSAQYPENTLASFRAALGLNVDGIELDIHLSADGIPMVIHDELLERTTNGSGLVRDYTAAQLAQLDAGNGEPIPTFEEVVDLVDGRLAFDIEFKSQGCEAAVLEILARNPDTVAAISSFDWEVLANVRAISPEMELWVLTHAVTDEAIEAARRNGATTLAVQHQGISPASSDKAAAAGFEVMAWTVNLRQEADRLRKLGVVAICTDDPDSIR